MPVPDAIPRSTIGFCWFWLAFASALSILGNIIHAVLKGPAVYGVLPAVAAAVPPIVLLGSTHFLGLLIRSRRHRLTLVTRAVYLAVLALMVAIAGCAFWLSFDALRDLAVTLGTPTRNAGLVPLIIDFSITSSTLALLYLTSENAPATHQKPRLHGLESAQLQPNSLEVERATPPAEYALPETIPAVSRDIAYPDESADTNTDTALDRPVASVASAGGYDFSDYAKQLVREGRTQQPAEVVAQVLDMHQSGMTAFAIANSIKLHRSTITRIIDASREDLKLAI